MITCISCSRIHGCKDARVAHYCDSFEYTPLIASREALVNIVGESAAITALRKQKAMATPEHPHTTNIKDLVAAGNVEGLNGLLDEQSCPLPYLVMAASHLTGDSTKIGAMLRKQTDKRSALVSLLIDLSKEAVAANGAEAPDNDDAPAAEEVVVEQPPKKRRKRRTKAEIEAAKAAKAAESAVAEEVAEIATEAVAANVDFDRAFNDILSAISDANNQQAETLATFTKTAKAALQDSNVRYNDLVERLTRVSNALVALEDQLMLTGMILEPAVRACFEDEG